jgi:hypothetical protein
MAESIVPRSIDLPAIVWIFDSGAEGPFPVSLYSLSRAAPSLYLQAPLVVFDCGISSDLRNWLISKKLPNLTVINCILPQAEKVIGMSFSNAAAVMRQRIELPRLLNMSINEGRTPTFETFLQIDTDTAFLSDPTQILTRYWGGEDIRCCYEWDWVGDPIADHQESMKFIRPSSFSSPNYSERLPEIAGYLDLSVGELQCIPTVNSGVWMSKVAGALSENWIRAYERLSRIDRHLGAGFFNSDSAEQNALSLGVYLGEISVRCLPRSMNNLPPKDPHSWPENVGIAHFVSFKKNWTRSAYRLWSRLRQLTQESGYAPRSLLMPEMLDPNGGSPDYSLFVGRQDLKSP